MIVVDATVAIKLVTLEPGADRTLARIAGESDRAAPDWIRLEVANALSRKVRRDGLGVDAAWAGRAGVDAILTREVATLDLLDEAFELSLKLRHAVYDCLYLALALRKQSVVITHDAEFAVAARRAGFEHAVELLT